MAKSFLYVVSASHSPDNVECLVPYLISNDEIFFGPCKKLLREKLRHQYLETSDDANPDENLIVVGVNGSNREKCRKIIWAGQISRLITFEVAYNELTASKYQQMRSENKSPLHVRPLYDGVGRFKGYEHCSLMHGKDEDWIRDFTKSNNRYFRLDGKKLLLTSNASQSQAFPRDCCFLLDSIFFAQGVGIPITNKILDVLKNAQPDRKDIDKYAIFGYRSDGSAYGHTGRWLEINEKNTEELLFLIKASIPLRNVSMVLDNLR